MSPHLFLSCTVWVSGFEKGSMTVVGVLDRDLYRHTSDVPLLTVKLLPIPMRTGFGSLSLLEMADHLAEGIRGHIHHYLRSNQQPII